MKSRVIFASLVLGLGLTIFGATAATTFTDDSLAANKPANELLVNGSEKQFATFVEQRAQLFSRTANWQNFMRVVSLYNNNPVSVLSLNTVSRDQFNEASSQVTKELSKYPQDAETLRWLNQVSFTTRMINFLWSAEHQPSETTELQ